MDDRIADLRRRAAQGEPGARARLLHERMRVGDLTRERVELAAYLGDPDARDALPAARTLDPSDPFALEPLRPFGAEPVVRMALAAAHLAVSTVEPGAAEVLMCVQRALLCPCEAHRDAVRRAPRQVVWAWESMLRHASGDGVSPGAEVPAAMIVVTQIAALPIGETRVFEAIRGEVVPWALGERDVVRERVEAAGPGPRWT